MDELTPKRKMILDFISKFSEERGFSPSIRQIVAACEISSTSVTQYHLRVLGRGGYIERQPDTPRSISLGRRRPSGRGVPLLGTIAAGEPIPVPSADTWTVEPEEIIDVRDELSVDREKVYALRVKGTSMVDALVYDGDTVILEPAGTAEDGQMVAAWLKDRDEATLKKLYREPDRICLQPANEAMPPIYLSPAVVEVQGRVVVVLRRLG